MNDHIITQVPTARVEIFTKIHQERLYQEKRTEGDKSFNADFDSLNSANDWVSFIVRYLGNACKFNLTPEEFETAMIKVAALAVASIESVEKNGRPYPRHYDV